MLGSLLRITGFPVESFKNDWKLLPNWISYSRIGLFWLPAFFLWHWPESWWALVAFVVFAATDGIDGYVARKYNKTSEWGAWLDPMADKLLVLCTLIALLFANTGNSDATSLYVLFWVSFLREITVSPAILVVQGRLVPPTLIGKVKMVAQCVAVGAWLVPAVLPWITPARDWLTWAVIALVVLSWAEYLWRYVLQGRIETPLTSVRS